jgi:hypothetical protein
MKPTEFSSDPKRLVILLTAFAGVIEIAVLFWATTPRAHLNIMQVVFVLFTATVLFRFRGPHLKESAAPQGSWDVLLPWLSVLIAALVWATIVTAFFINDDFGLLYVTRAPSFDLIWSMFRHGDGGIFYRPLTYLTFTADQAIWGRIPIGFHLTNIVLHLASVAGLFVMIHQLGGHRLTAAMTAGIFAAMPIQVESVAWMAGRFDVLSTTLTLWTVVCYLWSRSGGLGRYLLALALYVLAICSKETAFLIPALLMAIELVVFRTRQNRRIIGFLAAGAIMFACRWFALGGFGGYKTSGVSSMTYIGPKTIEGLLLRGPSQLLLGFNWTQPPGFLLVTSAITAGVLMFLAMRTKADAGRLRMIKLAVIWMILAMIPAHFLLMIGPGLSNSRVLCLASAGMAMLLGQLVSGLAGPRSRSIIYATLVVLFNVGVLHNLAAWRWTSSLGEETLRQVIRVEPSPPQEAQFVFWELPTTIRGVFFFSACLNESLKIAYDRDDISAVRNFELVTSNQTPSNEQRQIRIKWTGEPEALVVRQDRLRP